jgi:hypothetical protein
MSGMMSNILHKAPAPLRPLNPECPEALEETICKMLAKDREARYQSFEDVEFDLGPVIFDLRKENVRDLLTEAGRLIADGSLESAQAAVKQALEVEPGNRTARELRERVQREIKEKAVRPRIEALLGEGRNQLGARQFDQAIQKFESALRLDKSDTGIHVLLEEAQAALERAQRADRLVHQAREALESNNLTAAYKNASEALTADPQHADAQAVLPSIRLRIEERDRARRLRDGLGQVKGLMLLGTFGEAIAALEKIRADHPDSNEAGELLEKARHEQEAQVRGRRLQALIDEARELLLSRRFSEAADKLSESQTEFAESAQLRELASYVAGELLAQRRAEEVERVANEARALMDAKDYDVALDRLERALEAFPAAGELHDLVQIAVTAKAEDQRRSALTEVLQQVTELAAQQAFADALSRIGAFVTAHGASAALDSLRKRCEEGLEYQQQAGAIRKLTLDARALLDEGKLGVAVQVLRQATVRFPDERELADLLSLAQERLVEQQRLEAVSKVISEAESLARSKQFGRALELLDAGLQQHGAIDRLLRCREATLASSFAFEHERLRNEAIDRAGSLRAEGKLAEAFETVSTALSVSAGDQALLTLKRELEAEIARQNRTTEIQTLLSKAQELVETGQFLLATQILKDATSRYPSEEQFKNLMSTAEQRLREQQHVEAGWIRKRVAAAQKTLVATETPVWKKIGVGTGVVGAVGALFVMVLHWSRPAPVLAPAAMVYPLEIRSDPPGAWVHLEDRTCATPACRFNLSAGGYRVEARLDGYMPDHRRITLKASRYPTIVDITLTPVTQHIKLKAGTGTLRVQTDIPDVLIIIDKTPWGRTDSNGLLALRLAAQVHQVEAEKIDYERPPAKQVAVVNLATETVGFILVPKKARPDPTGIRVVPPITNAKTLALPKVDPEAQEWKQVRNASNPAEVQAFLARYPNGAYSKPAHAELAELDDLIWSDTNKNDPQPVQAYLDRLPNGAHRAEALLQIEELTWKHVDQNDEEALRAFFSQYPHSPHKVGRVRDQVSTTLFSLSGSLANGAGFNGTMLINTSTGTVSELKLTIGSPINIKLNRVFKNVGRSTTFVNLVGVSGHEFPNINMLFPISTLIGYKGGALCSTQSPCAGALHNLYSALFTATLNRVEVRVGRVSIVSKK